MEYFTYESTFKIRTLMLQTIGAWPTNNPSAFFMTRKYFCWFINIILVLLLVNAIFENIDDFNRLSQVIYILGALVCAIVKIATLHTHQNLFLTLRQNLKYPISMTRDKKFIIIIKKYGNFLKIVSLTYAGCLMSIVILFLGFPLIDHTAMFTFISVESPWLRRLLYGFQFLCMSVGAIETAAWDILVMEMMGIASIHLESLNMKLKSIQVQQQKQNSPKQNDVEQVICAEISGCVIWHQKIIA